MEHNIMECCPQKGIKLSSCYCTTPSQGIRGVCLMGSLGQDVTAPEHSPMYKRPENVQFFPFRTIKFTSAPMVKYSTDQL